MTRNPKVHCRYTRLAPIAELAGKENPRNPNRHSEAQLEKIGRVIRRNGWRAPVVLSARSGLIVKGHGRYQAALREGWKVVPVEIQKYRSEAEEHADMLADNRLAELSDRDATKTKELLADRRGQGVAIEMTGYSDAELADMLAPPKLEKIKVAKPPRLAWALVGVPIAQFGKVQRLLDRMPDGATIHTTANDAD